jgi:hypothetical protein
MRPVLYFSVSGAGSVTNPTAEIEFNGTTEDVTIEAVYLETVSTVHYFMVDLSDVMKYLMKSFDGGSYPDDLEFINGDRLQLFDEYFRTLVIDIYFERGTADEQTADQTNTWLYLASQMPSETGFNLDNILIFAQNYYLKWSKDTYNAIFFWHAGGAMSVAKATTQIINNITGWTNVDYTTFTASGAAITSAVCSATGKYCKSNVLSVISGDVVKVDCTLTLTSGAAPTIEMRRSDTNAVVSNQAALSAGANSKDLTLTYTGSVYLSVTSTGACNIALASVSINYPAGYYQLKFSKSTTKISAGANTIVIGGVIDPKTFYIDYDPNCSEVFNLCWQHPSMGYVSYPFRGNKVTGLTAKKGVDINKFSTTMVNANKLTETLSLEATKKVTLTARVNDEYWPLFEHLYSSRHVYLFVGASAANDSTLTWVECQVSGAGSYRSDRAKSTFSVDLTLPEVFNVRF